MLPWGLTASILPRGNVALPVALGLGALARLVLVGSPPLLSDDLYRFLFEGLALNAGHNPFLEAPAEIAQLDPWLSTRVNHPDIPSIYPPAAQWWFRLLATLGARPMVAQACTAAVDVFNIALLHRLCVTRSLPTWPALVWAIHPLAVLESANGAHLEPLAIALCLGTLLALSAGRDGRAVAWATLGIGVKLLPVFFVPALARRLGPRRSLTAAAFAVGALVVLALPVLSAGPALLAALQTYTSSWSFNGLLYPLLAPVLGNGARPALALAGLAVAAHAATHEDATKTWLQVAAGFLMLSPTVHPWYVLWALAPALVLGGRGWAVAATFLQCSYAVLLYSTPEGWTVPPWLGPLTWGSALVALGVAWAQSRRELSPTAE